MIKITNIETHGWEAAIRGMRNPKDSWHLSDSVWVPIEEKPSSPRDYRYLIGANDMNLAKRLIAGGSEHRKFLRDIHVQFDVTAPTFWWAEFDTYKVGTTRNSCSKMHRVHVKSFTPDLFSHECIDKIDYAADAFRIVLAACENLRVEFNETKNRDCWRALVELLPEGYNMKATWDGSMETLLNVMHQRAGHKLREEWAPFREELMQSVPYLAAFYDVLYATVDDSGKDGANG